MVHAVDIDGIPAQFVQAEIWLGRSVPAEARTEIRELLRKEA